MTTNNDSINENAVREKVREGYSKIAKTGQWSSVISEPVSASCCTPSAAGGGCCGSDSLTPDQVAQAIGYASTDLTQVPQGANMGLSCGNPTAIASLKEGEVVVDLGSGGGFDCFIAGPKVGKSGKVIGIDMTPDMLSKARKNTESYTERSGLSNVEFRLGEIEYLPVSDSSVDVVISNCVLNLSPNKAQVWKEIARILKPGGRVAISDLALLKPLPQEVQDDLEALVGCVAGAELVSEMQKMAELAGLKNISLKSKPEYIDAMTNWEDPLYQKIVSHLPEGSRVSEYVTSLDVEAKKV